MTGEVYGFDIGQFLWARVRLAFARKGSGETKISSVGLTLIEQSYCVLVSLRSVNITAYFAVEIGEGNSLGKRTGTCDLFLICGRTEAKTAKAGL